MSHHLTLRASPAGEELVLRVQGELDIAAEEEFKECLQGHLDHPYEKIVLDLRDVTFIDSTGLRLLLGLKKRLTEWDTKLVLIPGDGAVSRLLDLAGVRGWFEYG